LLFTFHISFFRARCAAGAGIARFLSLAPVCSSTQAATTEAAHLGKDNVGTTAASLTHKIYIQSSCSSRKNVITTIMNIGKYQLNPEKT
jgi:hypothetical protein